MAAGSTTGQLDTDLVRTLREMDESAKPWKLRPPDQPDDPARLLVGAQPDHVRDQLEDAGYSIHDLELPVSARGWLAAWEISP